MFFTSSYLGLVSTLRTLVFRELENIVHAQNGYGTTCVWVCVQNISTWSAGPAFSRPFPEPSSFHRVILCGNARCQAWLSDFVGYLGRSWPLGLSMFFCGLAQPREAGGLHMKFQALMAGERVHWSPRP